MEAKRAKRHDASVQERLCRIVVRHRDKGKCRVPGCKDAGTHLHHIVYRSKGGKWHAANIASLCAGHHALVHAGRITIAGDANVHLDIKGSRKDLALRL